ncbi:MAG TPA: alpha/beta hydrolase [Solirubrobacteraceae bacterium]|nr:alpha/beta hydrolase [Solirubrobacteraceae bacterium]
MSTVTAHDADKLLAETRAFNAQLEHLLAGLPSLHTIPPEQTRRARREGGGIYPAPEFLPTARTVEIDGPGGPLALRIIAPESEPAGTFLHIHGGGFVLGDNDLQDLRLDELGRETGMAAVSVGYRLAPEHPYPAALDDCEAAALWLLGEEGRAEVGAAGVFAIGGESAGAYLSVMTLLRLRDRHAVTGAFGAAVLEYGGFDLSMTPSQRLWGECNLVLSGAILNWFADQFVPMYDREQRRDPEISPLFADLSAMPPAVFTVGTEDALLDDTLFMEARWRAAGNATELHIWPEAPHGFISLPMTVAKVALAREYDFLRRTLQLQPA